VGALVQEKRIHAYPEDGLIPLQLTGAPGLYHLRLTTGKETAHKKIILK
jgi:hypothetical protein